MFCPKCGTKALEGAAFCKSCGAKLLSDDATQQAAAPTPVRQTQPQTRNAQSNEPKKKKSKKRPIILGAVALLLVVLMIAGLSDDTEELSGPARSDNEPMASQRQSLSVNLSESYLNEAEGISFKYPSAWVPVDLAEVGRDDPTLDLEDYVVFLANEEEGAPELNSYLEVLKFPDRQAEIDHLFISDKEFTETFDNDVTITKTSVIELDGVSARMIAYKTSEDIIYRSYLYGIGSNLYRVNLIRIGEKSGDFERFFDAIMDSYKITANRQAMAGTHDTGSSISADEAEQLIYDWIEDGHQIGYTCYPEYNGEGIMYSEGPEVYNFNLMVSANAWVPVMVEKGTGEIWADVEGDIMSIDSYYAMFYGGSSGGDEMDYEPEPDYAECPQFYDGNYIDENFEWVEMPRWSTGTYGNRSITGIVRNKTDKTFSYVQIMFTIYDSTGNQIGSALANTNYLNGAGTWKFEAAIIVDAPGTISFQFAEISAF